MGRHEFRGLQGMEVHITELVQEGRITYLNGYFVLEARGFDFEAIAIEGYGGPNVSAKLSDQAVGELSHHGVRPEDIEELIIQLQRKIIEGDLSMELGQRQQREPGSARSRDNLDPPTFS